MFFFWAGGAEDCIDFNRAKDYSSTNQAEERALGFRGLGLRAKALGLRALGLQVYGLRALGVRLYKGFRA